MTSSVVLERVSTHMLGILFIHFSKSLISHLLLEPKSLNFVYALTMLKNNHDNELFFFFLPISPMQYVRKFASTKLWFNIPLIALHVGM